MRKIIALALLGVLLAGCEDAPVEPVGEDDFASTSHHQARATHAHGGMDDGLLRVAAGR